MEVDEEKEKEAKKEAKSEEKKEPEANYLMLQNPARVVRLQVR